MRNSAMMRSVDFSGDFVEIRKRVFDTTTGFVSMVVFFSCLRDRDYSDIMRTNDLLCKGGEMACC